MQSAKIMQYNVKLKAITN